jgi:hypothetical protein
MNAIRQQIEESYPDSKMLFADGFDDAILGVDNNQWDQRKGDEGDDSKERVIYSVKKIIEILMTRDGMGYEVALDHYDYNISGGFVGIHTPIFSEDEDLDIPLPTEVKEDITTAWNEIEEFLTDERELSAEELRNVHDVMIARLKKALSVLSTWVDDQE